jgi:hypothetical protein
MAQRAQSLGLHYDLGHSDLFIHLPRSDPPVRPGAVSPDRALCLPTFAHFLIVNKTSHSLTLSIHLPPQCGEATSHAGEEESCLITCSFRHSVD